MDAFVLRLVRRLCEPSQPLSRNRHFHAFSSPEGRRALKISRRLKSLRRDILACADEGRDAHFRRFADEDGQRRVELTLERAGGFRQSLLQEAEFDLLQDLPGVRSALEAASPGARRAPLSGESATDASKTNEAGPRMSTLEKSGSQRT
jgi:hypothetical protein